MNEYELVIFDIDGTILDSAESILKSAKEAIEVLGLSPVSETELRKCIGPPLAKTMVERKLLDEKDFQRFNETFRTLYKDKYLMDATLYDGIIDTIAELSKTKKVAVATNKRYDYTQTLMDNFGVSKYCKVIKGTDFENKLKKSDLIGQCLLETETNPRFAVMIGDTTNDMNSARAIGIDFIAVTYGFGFRKGDIEPSADSPKELLELLR